MSRIRAQGIRAQRFRAQACAGTWLALAGFSAFAFYDRYWIWRGCFNELGRCYDPVSGEIFLEQAGVTWSSLTVLFLTLAAFAWRGSRRSDAASDARRP